MGYGTRIAADIAHGIRVPELDELTKCGGSLLGRKSDDL
jgi:hypothetical protein